jgi:ribonuclease P protein component
MVPKKKRVSSALFPILMKTGKVRSTPAFSLRLLPSEKPAHLAIVVSKGVAKGAVERNKIRRRWYSALMPMLPKTGTYVFFIKKPGILLSLKEIVLESTPFFPK